MKWLVMAGVGLVLFFLALGCFFNRYVLNLSFLSFAQDLLLLLAGTAITYYGFKRAVRVLIESIAPFTPVNIYEYLRNDLKTKQGPRIVVIGGGTGLSVLLRGLKRYSSNLTAVVTVTDDGGSSGRLRGELGILPPGDIRNCLVALAETENTMDQVFQHRFQSGSLEGHNLGNLLLTALTEIKGDFVQAIQEVSSVLAVRGQVLPATLDQVTLAARMAGGEVVHGESSITAARKEVEEVFLVPADCKPLPATVKAIMEADAIILGPGSLYTSLIPNLLVTEIGDAFRKSAATKIFVTNIMTEPGETTDYRASDHLKAVNRHIGDGYIHYVIVNDRPIDGERLERYQAEGAIPVQPDLEEISAMGVQLISEDVLGNQDVAWHDPLKLAEGILKIIYRNKGLKWQP